MEGNKTMKNTKEEFNNGDIIVCWAKGGAYGDLLTVLERHIGGTLFTALKCNKSGTVFITNCMDDYEHYNPLTDQIKSMEGQVKELRDENEIQGNYNDMLIKELESLQKENERLYDALSNIMNNERWLEMNIDTVNNLLSKHA